MWGRCWGQRGWAASLNISGMIASLGHRHKSTGSTEARQHSLICSQKLGTNYNIAKHEILQLSAQCLAKVSTHPFS